MSDRSDMCHRQRIVDWIRADGGVRECRGRYFFPSGFVLCGLSIVFNCDALLRPGPFEGARIANFINHGAEPRGVCGTHTHAAEGVLVSHLTVINNPVMDYRTLCPHWTVVTIIACRSSGWLTLSVMSCAANHGKRRPAAVGAASFFKNDSLAPNTALQAIHSTAAYVPNKWRHALDFSLQKFAFSNGSCNNFNPSTTRHLQKWVDINCMLNYDLL